MTNDSELPVFPTSAPAVFCDSDVAPDLFRDVLARLAEVVDVDDDQLRLPTPCAGFDVGELRTHVLGWLSFLPPLCLTRRQRRRSDLIPKRSCSLRESEAVMSFGLRWPISPTPSPLMPQVSS